MKMNFLQFDPPDSLPETPTLVYLFDSEPESFVSLVAVAGVHRRKYGMSQEYPIAIAISGLELIGIEAQKNNP